MAKSGIVVAEGCIRVKNEIRNEDETVLVVALHGEVKDISVLTEFKNNNNNNNNQIQVSNFKNPFFYYYNLSKRYIKQ